jgi:lipoate-protein ligase B
MAEGDLRMTAADERRIRAYDLGLTNYEDVHRLQQRLHEQRREGRGADVLLLTEHRPVITLGRSHPVPSLRVDEAAVRQYGIAIVPTERGGNITYHGPGQLVAYGIIDLRAWNISVVDYVSGLERTVIGVLADWGIRGERREGMRGVFVDDRKIASVGIYARRWITMHGVALNVDPDMGHWSLINPCGMADVEVTSLAAEVGKGVRMEEVRESFLLHFGRVFDCRVEVAEVRRKAALGG